MSNLKVPKASKLVYVDWLRAYICVLRTKSQFAQFLQENPGLDITPDDWGRIDGMSLTVEIGGSDYFILCLPDKKALVHECVHLSEQIMTSRDIPFAQDGLHEVRAYMVAHVYDLLA